MPDYGAFWEWFAQQYGEELKDSWYNAWLQKPGLFRVSLPDELKPQFEHFQTNVSPPAEGELADEDYLDRANLHLWRLYDEEKITREEFLDRTVQVSEAAKRGGVGLDAPFYEEALNLLPEDQYKIERRKEVAAEKVRAKEQEAFEKETEKFETETAKQEAAQKREDIAHETRLAQARADKEFREKEIEPTERVAEAEATWRTREQAKIEGKRLPVTASQLTTPSGGRMQKLIGQAKSLGVDTTHFETVKLPRDTAAADETQGDMIRALQGRISAALPVKGDWQKSQKVWEDLARRAGARPGRVTKL